MTTIAILGIGTLGEILLGGLLKAGWDRDQIVVVARRPE
ncbi:MAG: NAD(P)-binding domain-containing protein, partial [Mycobacteriales bacterium]